MGVSFPAIHHFLLLNHCNPDKFRHRNGTRLSRDVRLKKTPSARKVLLGDR